MWIKVCGIKDIETACHIAEVDIDAIGLNFYHRSPRYVELNDAIEISNLLPVKIVRVGVFVNHPVRDVESIAKQCRLDILQLHGDEPPAYLVELKRRIPDAHLVRAWRMDGDSLKNLQIYLNECSNWNCELSGCLVDAHVAGVYGGSGKKVPWDRLRREYNQAEWPPLILAGGLKPSNIAEAISSVKPWGVDVASGVESIPGVKDLDLVRKFVLNARNANTT